MTREQEWLLTDKYGGHASSEFERDCARLVAGEPVAYLIGWQPFLGMKIFLDSKPLIPRPETEWWVEQLNAQIFDGEHVKFLDLCAGSGAIGCALLKKLPDAHVSFGELDPAHEVTIRKNIRENHLDASRTDIRVGDLFAPFADQRFDYIAANPPYIPDERELPASVAAHEPTLALRAGADGLAIIQRIAAELRPHLTLSGQAWIECDSEHAEAARGLFATAGFSAKILTDQFDRPRVIVVS